MAKKVKVNNNCFIDFIRKVNIEGEISSAVIRIEDGKAICGTVDPSNTAVLFLEKKINASTDESFATNDLSLLNRLLTSTVGGGKKDAELFLSVGDGQLSVFKSAKGKRQFDFTLSGDESVVDMASGDEGKNFKSKFKKMKKAFGVKFKASDKFMSELLSKAPLIDANTITFEISKSKASRVLFTDALHNNVYVDMPKKCFETRQDLTIAFMPKVVIAVFSVIGGGCTLYFDEENPIVVSIADGDYAIAPVVKEE